MLRQGNFIKCWLPVIAWAFAILFVSTLPGKAIGPAAAIPYSSAIVHFAEFLVFGFLLHRALSSGELSARNALVMTVILSFAFSGITEILQLFVPGRFFDYGDILTNGFGALAGVGRNIFVQLEI